MTVLQNILDQSLLDPSMRVKVSYVFDTTVQSAIEDTSGQRTRSTGNAKSLPEFFDLVKASIEDSETRAGTPDENKIIFTEEDPDVQSQSETITFSVITSKPGSFGQGSPFESKIKNQRPILREEGIDKENPGYRFSVHGYFFDNIIRFTCWARTNKAANARAEWFQSLMEEYSWWFKMQGVDRTLFLERNTDIVTTIDNNKWYGRPIDYFVRTEKLLVFSEKVIEEILINLSVKNV